MCIKNFRDNILKKVVVLYSWLVCIGKIYPIQKGREGKEKRDEQHYVQIKSERQDIE